MKHRNEARKNLVVQKLGKKDLATPKKSVSQLRNVHAGS